MRVTCPSEAFATCLADTLVEHDHDASCALDEDGDPTVITDAGFHDVTRAVMAVRGIHRGVGI
jgi:hypothetical protein